MESEPEYTSLLPTSASCSWGMVAQRDWRRDSPHAHWQPSQLSGAAAIPLPSLYRTERSGLLHGFVPRV